MKCEKFMAWIFVLIFAIILAGCSAEAEPAANENLGKLTVPVETISLDKSDENFSYYDLTVQEELQQQLNGLKEKKNYTFKEPLLVMNPYGTNTTGLYLYFEEESSSSLSYTVSVDGSSDFTKTAKDANKDETQAEYQLIGLVPGEENNVSFTYKQEDGSTMIYEFTVTAPKSQSGYPIEMVQTEKAEDAELSDGLFYTLGTDGYAGYSYVFDNEGTMRAELITEDYRTDRMVFYEETLITAITDSMLARIDSLGKIVDIYQLEGFNLHHDIALNENGQLIVLATDQAKNSVEDVVLSLDLETGEYKKLLDFDDLMGSYKEMTAPVSDEKSSTWDWLHYNSIDLAGQDSMILSSRETSAIMKISGIYDNPAIDYLIGNEGVWAGTEFEDKLLTKSGDFEGQSGQHSVTYLEDDSLPEGQYYLYMFNNNYWWYLSRPDYDGPTNAKASLAREANEEDHSQFYKYLVDEKAGTYQLVQQFDVPYSSIVSSAQIYGDSIIIDSGVSKILGEYDTEGNLLAQFPYEADRFTYRIFKDTFEGYWFE
ncbi:aryl-sulfate sulfotransferase [Planomicrobium sp. CPCC 101079]|uniref:aryl-sulfate sulfotransferase n=1 Tax=Planomicrobium sp. CPCC 101079 TaxID=2599618 RepID=UPI0016480A82|nr:aryl-sulfate sulfotransferase [Planomicrobium sp. CPCC 101079]